MNMKEDFLAQLQENEDDISLRLIYADWLDENGEHEEAQRQRKWPAAKAWIVDFLEEHNPFSRGSNYERPMSYGLLMARCQYAVENNLAVQCGNNETLTDALREHRNKFWKNWTIVTGFSGGAAFRESGDDDEDEDNRPGFSCAC